LAALDAERQPIAADLVETSRRLGRGLVECAPDWSGLTGVAAEQFMTGLIAGQNLYLQPTAGSAP
jgi:hypothetical protein